MSHLLTEHRNGIAIVTLNRPEKRNALSPEMVVRLAGFWREVAEDHAVRAVVVTGAGDQAFSAVGDLGSLIPLMMRTREPQDEWEAKFAADRKQLHAALLRNASFFKPVVAAINGHALAGGAEFVLATDLRVMSNTATFALTEVRRGLIASGGSLVRMSRQIPWAQAMEILLLGEPISAARAFEMGLVNRVVPPEYLTQIVTKYAQTIASKSALTLKIGKEAFYRQAEMSLADAYRHASEVMVENMLARDAEEGIGAFLGKRDPEWTGE